MGVRKRLCISTLIALIILPSCYYSIGSLGGFISIQERFVIYPMCVGFCLFFEKILLRIRLLLKNWMHYVLIITMCLCFTFCEVGYFYIQEMGVANKAHPIPYFLISSFWCFPVAITGFSGIIWLFSIIKISNVEKVLPFEIIAMVIGVIVPCAFMLYAFNPAITSPDSAVVYDTAHWIGTEPIYNWHPPFYIWLVSLLLKICDSISFLIIVQYIYFTIVVVDCLIFFRKSGLPISMCYFIYFCLVYGYNNIIQLTTFWRDIPYVISLLWFTLLMCKMILHKESYERSLLWYFSFTLSAILTIFMRQNGILPVLITIIPLFVFLRKNYRTWISGIVILLLVILIKGPLFNSLKVIPKPGQKYYAMANDILYVYYNAQSVSEDVKKIVDEITGGNPDEFEYDPYYTRNIGYPLEDYSIAEFLSVYVSTFLDHPKAMIKGFLCRTTLAWSIDHPRNEGYDCSNYLKERHIEGLKYDFPYREPNEMTDFLTNVFKEKLGRSALFDAFCWRTAVYNLLILSYVVLLIICFRRKAWVLMIPLYPILANVISLLVAAGWPDYRLYWPSTVIGIFLLGYVPIVYSKKKYSFKFEDNDNSDLHNEMRR